VLLKNKNGKIKKGVHKLNYKNNSLFLFVGSFFISISRFNASLREANNSRWTTCTGLRPLV